MAAPKNELPFMPVVVDEELAIAEDLSNEQLGALYRLKLKLWRANGYLDEDKLVAASRAGKRWGSIGRAVLEHLTIAAGKFSSGAVLMALEAVRKRRAERVERASKAALTRWAFEEEHARLKRSGKSVSDVLATRVSDAILKSDNSLKENKPTMLGASAKQCLDDANQNQNNIDSRTFSSGDNAAEPPRGPPAAPVRINAQQWTVLFQHGTELLRVRMGLKRLPAHGLISKWFDRVGDADRLAMILADADQQNIDGKDFFDAVERHIDGRDSPPVHSAVDNRTPSASGEGSGLSEGQASASEVIPKAVDNAAATGDELSDDPQAVGELWLKSEGRRLLLDRLPKSEQHPGRVDTLTERWLREVGGDHAALAAIVAGATAKGKNPNLVLILIGDGIRRHLAGLDGAQLPLMPPRPSKPTAAIAPSVVSLPATDLKKAVGDD